MAEKLQPVRGTHDWLPDDHRKYRFVVETARRWAERYGCEQMDTPIFEFTDVFHRTLGDTSDVVTKETYTFTDRGNESLTLRPEFTAAIARAFITHGMQQSLPCKFFYAGPAFRYERPQKGRMRQFHQIGVEVLGVESPLADIEVITLAHDVLNALGLQGVTLEINTLGDDESRSRYRDILTKYFEGHKNDLSEDSKMRLSKNPLRILDSKDEGDRKLIAGAPKLRDHLSEDAKAFHAHVTSKLSALGITFTENDRLVRGLDYYSHTVFEFTSTALGAQNTVLAGGRYNKLIGQMGGPETTGIGWAAGVERLTSLIDFGAHPDFKSPARPLCIVPLSQGDVFEYKEVFELAHKLRANGHSVDVSYKGNASKRLQRANKIGALFSVIIGENEHQKQEVTLKNMDTGEQTVVSQQKLVDVLAPYRPYSKSDF